MNGVGEYKTSGPDFELALDLLREAVDQGAGRSRAKSLFLLAVMSLNSLTGVVGAHGSGPGHGHGHGHGQSTGGGRGAARGVGGGGEFQGTRLGRIAGSEMASKLGSLRRPRAQSHEIFDMLNRSAALGSRDAHQMMGTLYSTGLLGAPVDSVLSLLHFRFAAMGGNIAAVMSMGFRHLHGVGAAKNCSKAATYYEIAANAAIDALGPSMVPTWKRPSYVRLAAQGKGSGSQSDSEVLQFLHFAADKGDAQAFEMLGLIHFHGARGTRPDFLKARDLLKIAAEDHESVAAYADLGHIALHGLAGFDAQDGGTPTPRLSSSNGIGGGGGGGGGAEWEFFPGSEPAAAAQPPPPHGPGPNYELAYEYFAKAANAGNAQGMNGLGYMHMHGLGVPKNWARAVELFEKAAQARSVDGIYNMGLVHLTPPKDPDLEEANPTARSRSGAGVGGTTTAGESSDIGGFNFKKSVAHFRVAAKSGHMQAMHKLAHMTLHGLGVEKPNCREAAALFKGVAEAGPQSELLSMAERAFNSNNLGAALVWYSVAADMGFELAQANSAHLYEEVPSNTLKTLGLVGAHLESAADPKPARKEESSSGSGSDGKRGVGEQKLSSAAAMPFSLRMWKLAAKQQNVAANIRAGDMYFYGLQGIREDFEQAAAHYRAATALGSPQAMFNLGWHYQYGVGLPVDFHLSKRYYDRAYEASPLEASAPTRLALFSLWFYSSWASSSSWHVMFEAMLKSIQGYVKRGRVELALGDIPDVSAYSLGGMAPRMAGHSSFSKLLSVPEDSETIQAIFGLAALILLLFIRSCRRAAEG